MQKISRKTHKNDCGERCGDCFEVLTMAKYRCTVCNYVYDEVKEGKKFSDLPKEWVCPICGVSKSAFVLLTEKSSEATEVKKGKTVSEVLVE
jgi:pyruvate oxidase